MGPNMKPGVSGSEGRSGPGRFCPHMGHVPNTNAVFTSQLETLLVTRLRMASVVITLGLGAFVVRNLIVGLTPQTGGMPTLIPQAIVTTIIGALSLLLFMRKSEWSVFQLRGVEIAIFGLTGAGLAWLQWGVVRFCPPEELASIAAAYPARVAIPWVLLVQIYGLFIPNTWRRAATAIIALAIAPLLLATLTAIQEPLIRAVLDAGGRSAMALWLAIASAAAIYGSHRFSEMRRETFDARTLGLYTLRQKLGEGGMGEVYLAEHELLKRPCAIKLIRADKAGDPKTIARFETEVQSTARLTHPNTVAIFDFGITDDQTFFYVMEYLPGMNLEEIVDQFGPLPPERAVHLLRQVCSALAESHAAGLIHRDIKPGNIYAAERGGLYDVAKLLDFGLVKSFEPSEQPASLTLDGAFVGSPHYAPPECTVGNGQPDGRSDIYSIGATAYHLLTGQPVFKSDNALKVMLAHASQTPVALTDLQGSIPAELAAIVMKCLEKEPDDRFATVTELDEALSRVPLDASWTQQHAKAWWMDKTVRADVARAGSSGDTVTQILSSDTK